MDSNFIILTLVGVIVSTIFAVIIRFKDKKIIAKDKEIIELNSELNLYNFLARDDQPLPEIEDLQKFSTDILSRLDDLIQKKYEKFLPVWSLSDIGCFVNEWKKINDREKQILIKRTFTRAILGIDYKELVGIVFMNLRHDHDFEEDDAKEGINFIISVLKEDGGSLLRKNFNYELEEETNALLESDDKTDWEKVLIKASSIKLNQRLNAS